MFFVPFLALEVISAGVAGNLSGAGTGTEVFVGLDGSTTRFTSTVDASGNRTVAYNVAAMIVMMMEPEVVIEPQEYRID